MYRKRTILFITILCSLFWSCESNKVNIPSGAFDEFTVDLSGSWKIAQVIMNNQDITERLDFSGLILKLNMENNSPANYNVEGPVTPFLVNQDGNWEFDDPAYPTSIYFMSGPDQAIANFDIPPISNDNQFAISFSLGCADNKYVYHFKKQE